MKILMALLIGLPGPVATADAGVDEVRLRAALENIRARTSRPVTARPHPGWTNLIDFVAEVFVGVAITGLPAYGWPRLRGRIRRVPTDTLALGLAAVAGVTGGLVLLSHAVHARRVARIGETVRISTSPEVMTHFFNLTLNEQFGLARRDPGLAQLVFDMSDAYQLIDRHRGANTRAVSVPYAR